MAIPLGKLGITSNLLLSTLLLAQPANAKTEADQALTLLSKAYACSPPPEVMTDNDQTIRRLSDHQFIGNIDKFVIETHEVTRRHYVKSNSVSLTDVRSSSAASFANIDKVEVADKNILRLYCALGRKCFNSVSAAVTVAHDQVGSVLCDNETADNAKFAVEILIRANSPPAQKPAKTESKPPDSDAMVGNIIIIRPRR
ncbi:hypothetical protein [Bradyrhizobium erythrophlei]|uniref:Uncharacterized protein n=1 Tax=Bradyrhizobium erythrophlei TaxID=1437360 RepID=A0A1H4P1X5_9BRAD|nr:hypothetical protein [Bradyrhizobium erythrophlei]SEC01285.1 hypothetical protein SAMN05444164_0797 [Bradyrhizobium erythrophlei]